MDFGAGGDLGMRKGASSTGVSGQREGGSRGEPGYIPHPGLESRAGGAQASLQLIASRY